MHTLNTLAQAIGGHYCGVDMALPPISIDTRTLTAGDLFVAIQGPNFDGYDYIDRAVAQGAVAIMVQQEMPVDVPQIVVADTTQGFGEMAQAWRQQFAIPVIALTGSCGKTTTKEMLVAILSEVGAVCATSGNQNNQYGVTMTLLRLRAHHDYAVIEMGTNGPGEIDYLAALAQPTLSLITNIRECHLSGLHSLAGISTEKSAIYRHLCSDGVAVLNADESFIADWQALLADDVATYTFSSQQVQNTDVSVVVDQQDATGTQATIQVGTETGNVYCPLFARHIGDNMAAAVAAASAAQAPMHAIVQGLRQVSTGPGRFYPQVMPRGWTLIDDTYNASPSAVQSAIETLATLPGRRILVMSHLGELGDKLMFYQREMGKWMAAAQLDHVFVYGDAHLLQETLSTCSHAQYFADKDQLVEALRLHLAADVTLLVKGKRSCRMETIIHQLMEMEILC